MFSYIFPFANISSVWVSDIFGNKPELVMSTAGEISLVSWSHDEKSIAVAAKVNDKVEVAIFSTPVV